MTKPINIKNKVIRWLVICILLVAVGIGFFREQTHLEVGHYSTENHRLIEVDGGNLSGYREAEVVVDIGFGDRDYFAYTNAYGQLVKVVADEIILQDEETEPVLSTGRYYRDEAKVPGVESPTLDEGHVIADSLGGVANAYNITPQDSTVNRHGEQADMERRIREAGGATDFEAIITYPDETTQIPSHYYYTYTINGTTFEHGFYNGDVWEHLEDSAGIPAAYTKEGIHISALDKVAEYVGITNNTDETINLLGWQIVSVTGNQTFEFPEYILEVGETVYVGDSERNAHVDLHWMDGHGIWNNSKSDPAELYDEKGQLVNRYED